LVAKNALSLDGSISNLSSGLSLPNDRTITISVLAGSSNGLRHQLTKAKTSIGRTGGGADIEIDDPQVSPLHCVVGVANDIVRLCDLDSVSGTYANGKRVQAAELEHLSEFRLGSTWLVVTIVPKHFMDSTSF
jgi:pSer/pThr/pTyr-binding forkhead associated (FHA) protein